MPEFTVHVDPDELARRELAAGQPPATAGDEGPAAPSLTEHHGARDARLAARQRSERDHAERAPGGAGRSYAFRRS
jgi:hypothetical protein